MARKAGGFLKLYQALRSPNTCKTCAFGMGGVNGGMVNEAGETFQVCKKSMQAQAQDMQPGIPAEFFERNGLAELATLSGKQLESLGRLIHPIYAGVQDTHFRVISWQDALDLLVEKWRDVNPDRSFFYTSGRSSMEAAFLVQLLARQWGTNNVNNCSYYCHQASGVGLSKSLGGGTATVELQDISKADLVVLIGANPASNHPRLVALLAKLRSRGGEIVVLNPFKEIGLLRFNVPSAPGSLLFGSEIATLYLQPHCGGDLGFLKAAAVHLWRNGAVEHEFMRDHCNGYEAFGADLEHSDLELLLAQSGLSMAELQTFCEKLKASRNTIYAWAMGVTHQQHGVQTVQAIANLALLRGMIGKPGAGMMPIRGHSNVQGVGSVGVVPKLKPEMAGRLLERLKVPVPETPGMDTYSCMEAAQRGAVDFALLVGGNLYAANPDSKWSAQALNNIAFTTFMSTTMNLGHIHGRGREALILPVRARDEEKQSTSQESMFNYVRLSRGGQPGPAPELRSESEVLAYAGEKLLGDQPVAWSRLRDHEKIRELISDNVPWLAPISELGKGKEFTIPGRILHQPKFKTENGRANLAILEAVDARPRNGFLNLMTLRSEGQFNTIVYEEEDIYRGVQHRNVVFINHGDAETLGVAAGEWVRVESRIGYMRAEVVVADIRAGNVAMYYPEANMIVPGSLDPQSRTPVFKRVEVTIRKS
jgi:molybdopterin-dependent oxidoreductase alpha subunit